MSRDRFYDPQAGLSIARVRKQPGHSYTPLYMGDQREPKLADEAGAIAVVELLFGGRVVLFPHDENYLRVMSIR